MNVLPTWRYRLCLRLVSPLLLVHCVSRSLIDGGWQYFKDRLGFVKPDTQTRVHIHAASVGEIITVLPLLERLQTLDHNLALLVTTNTPTGASVLRARHDGNIRHAYLPIDFAGATSRFFARQSISNMWVVETEIWPWLYARAKQRDIPVVLINARLSHKSRGAAATFFDATYKQTLAGVHVLARSDEDAQRYIERGAQKDKVCTIGNLKLSSSTTSTATTALINTPYLLAASTHDDEELLLAQAWLTSASEGLLVIAPRHVERGARISKSLHALQKELDPSLPPPALRSQQQQPTPACRLYIADTLGELHHWYAYASAAFVGGSLIRHGGHNVLEPARTSTPIIVGPHTYNFEEEVNALRSANAIAVADNVDEVIRLFLLALSDPQWAETLGTNANDVINDKSEVLDTYIESLKQLAM